MKVCCENCQRLELADEDDVFDVDFCPVWQSCIKGEQFIPKAAQAKGGEGDG